MNLETKTITVLTDRQSFPFLARKRYSKIMQIKKTDIQDESIDSLLKGAAFAKHNFELIAFEKGEYIYICSLKNRIFFIFDELRFKCLFYFKRKGVTATPLVIYTSIVAGLVWLILETVAY